VHAHIVLAHPEAQSFNAHLADTARRTLEAQGWTVSVSDLYPSGFDPCERADHYASPLNASRFDVQSEQRHASVAGTIPADVATEIALLDRADLVILQYPMWWHLPPAMLKGWLDRVFIYGEVYTSAKRFEHGRFVGRRAMLSVTVGTSEATYAYNGRSGDIDLMLWPVNFSLAYVGYDVAQAVRCLRSGSWTALLGARRRGRSTEAGRGRSDRNAEPSRRAPDRAIQHEGRVG
jgi:NAD(P)H dehydrogenase (quinone)